MPKKDIVSLKLRAIKIPLHLNPISTVCKLAHLFYKNCNLLGLGFVRSRFNTSSISFNCISTQIHADLRK